MEVRCNNCWWHGNNEDLEVFQDPEDNEHYFTGCPNCEDDGYLMDLEDPRADHPIWKAINKNYLNQLNQ